MEKIAIVIPVFYRDHLEKCLNSILANECDVYIVNDSSEPLDYRHERVTIIDNHQNLGVGISRNRGIDFALKGDYGYIGFIDADSVVSRTWLSQCLATLQDPNVIGVSGLALNPNQDSRIARVKFLLKEYGRRSSVPFQIDCSIFKREVFTYANFGARRIGEDSFFLGNLDSARLRVNTDAISYHHEVNTTRSFFKKEMVGALYSLSTPIGVARSFLLTPYTCLKMLMRWKRSHDYPLASLVWLVRQIIWNFAYVLGRLSGYAKR